jgi:hypothetical protein
MVALHVQSTSDRHIVLYLLLLICLCSRCAALQPQPYKVPWTAKINGEACLQLTFIFALFTSTVWCSWYAETQGQTSLLLQLYSSGPQQAASTLLRITWHVTASSIFYKNHSRPIDALSLLHSLHLLGKRALHRISQLTTAHVYTS